MIYLEKIKIVNKTYPGSKVLKQNMEIICDDINLFVGDQGCGKSTMLQLLQKKHSDVELTISDFTKTSGIKTYFFDSEKDNPRIKDTHSYSNPDGTSKGIGVGGAIATRFMSHGEVLERMVINPLSKAKDCIIFLDEPESGLSITNQFRLIAAIKNAVQNRCQLFIATHCYPLIESFNVFSLEDNKLMSGIKFINLTTKKYDKRASN